MRKTVHIKLTGGRIRVGEYASDDSEGLMGAFTVRGPYGADLRIISSGTAEWDKRRGRQAYFGWEHVSVSTDRRCPNWPEMSFVKDLFWEPEETVVQFHPPQSEYVNHHPYCLHLWRPIDAIIPLPPSFSVGPKGESNDR